MGKTNHAKFWAKRNSRRKNECYGQQGPRLVCSRDREKAEGTGVPSTRSKFIQKVQAGAQSGRCDRSELENVFWADWKGKTLSFKIRKLYNLICASWKFLCYLWRMDWLCGAQGGRLRLKAGGPRCVAQLVDSLLACVKSWVQNSSTT